MTPDASNTVVGVFASADRAREAVQELLRSGFSQERISMITRSEGEQPDTTSKVVKDAEIGAAAGGIGGILLGVATAAVPGVGPVMVMGPLLGALGGASLGAVAGGLIGALTKIGVPKEDASNYVESVRRGDAIVTVRADRINAERALKILDRMGAVDIEARIANWRERGWRGHNPGVEPLSEDELRREREFYASGGHRASEWEPETEVEKEHAGDEPGTLWPHREAYDLGESLVEVAESEEPLRRRARIYEVEERS